MWIETSSGASVTEEITHLVLGPKMKIAPQIAVRLIILIACFDRQRDFGAGIAPFLTMMARVA